MALGKARFLENQTSLRPDKPGGGEEGEEAGLSGYQTALRPSKPGGGDLAVIIFLAGVITPVTRAGLSLVHHHQRENTPMPS